MYSKIYDLNRRETVQKASLALARVNSAPILFRDEDAKAFFEGIKALNKLKGEEIEKLKNLSTKELEAHWDDSDEGKKIKAAVSTMAKALKATNDAILGKGMQNPSLGVAMHREKSFHGVGNVDLGRSVLELASLSNGGTRPEIDAGWMGLYTMVDARGRNEIKVSDVLGFLRVYELKIHEEVVLTPLGDQGDDRIGMRRFGGGYMFDQYDMANNVYDANTILTNMRNAFTEMKGVVGYRELCIDQGLSYAFIGKYAGATGPQETDWQLVSNQIHTLNEAARKMKLNALQIAEKGGKANKTTEARIPLSPNSPLVVLYNPVHAEAVDKMLRMNGGDNGINSRLMHNFQFQETHMVPVSGGLTRSAGAAVDRDEWNLYDTVSESATKSGFGVRLVIPQNRNIYAIYKDLEFGQDTRFGSQSTVVAAFERYGAAVDSRQTAKVALS